ncbi:MAG TPA: tetratricopeptide repeat protein [Candidatus Megaira endosymbiont of Nemacystus decipiens]|nr:tetratricopeptide repeat protein [Candidatus Megaera endosymbiont of Nemacystus decipiens]
MREIETRIVTLKQKLLGPVLDSVISEEDLSQVKGLVDSEHITIAEIEKIDQELYKEIIVKLVHQRTDNSKQLLSLVFRDLADLHEKLADLTPDQDSEKVKHFTLSSQHKKLKYYTDSATFLQYSLLNSQNKAVIENEIYSKLSAIEGKIFSVTGNSNTKTTAEKVKIEAKNYKTMLGKLRSECITKLELAENKDSNQKETIQSVFEYTTDKMNGFLKKIYENTIGELEQKPPCKFAIVGLGSMALKQMTPWSDLEFAILLEKETQQIKQYFRDLSHIVNLKMINLGETVLPSNKYIIDLSRFEKQGVNFDLWGKTPLGRIGGDKPYDLIGTKDWLLWYVKNEKNKATHIDKNLPYILESVAYVCGDGDLVEAYQKDIVDFLHKDYIGEEKNYKDRGLKNHQVRAIKILKEGGVELNYIPVKSLGNKLSKGNIDEFIPTFESNKEGSLLDVKQEIYRLPDRMIYNLGAYFGVHAGSAWDTINELEKAGRISKEGAVNLKNAADFATSLRLKSYSQSDSQTASVSTYIPVLEHLEKEAQDSIIRNTFHVKNKEKLYDFYHTMIMVIRLSYFICNTKTTEKAIDLLSNNNLYEDSNYTKARIFAKFLEYDKAIKHMELARKENSSYHQEVLSSLSSLYQKNGMMTKALDTALESLDKEPGSWSAYLDVAIFYSEIGDMENAKIYYEQSDEIFSKSKEEKTAKDIMTFYNNLILYYAENNQQLKALSLIKAFNEKYENKIENVDSRLYSTLGSVYYMFGYYDEAEKFYNKALEGSIKFYSKSPNNPVIASDYNNLANLYLAQNNNHQAEECYVNALTIWKSFYNQNENNLDIAKCYNNIGLLHEDDNVDLALEYYNKAIKIRDNLSNGNHPDQIDTYANLANFYNKYQQYCKAKECFDKALKIYQTNHHLHSDFARCMASCHNAMGNINLSKGHYYDAIKNYEESKNIYESIYRQGKNLQIVGKSEFNIGSCYEALSNHSAAIAYYKQALNNYKTDSGKYDNASDIALCLYKLCSEHLRIGKFDAANEYISEALANATQDDSKIFGQIIIFYTMSHIAKSYELILSDDIKTAQEYYKKGSAILGLGENLNLSDPAEHIEMSSVVYDLQIPSIIINHQKVLLKLDPELKYGNHYQNLARYLALNRNIEEANEAFKLALYFSDKIGLSLLAEYAQFLIVNKEKLLENNIEVNSDKVSGLLYKVINTKEDNSELGYRKTEKNFVLPIIKKLIEANEDNIIINPKTLAYYMLIANPEYIVEGDNIEDITKQFEEHCNYLKDEVSLALLLDMCDGTSDDDLLEAADDEVFASIPNTNLEQWYEDA